MVGTRKTRISIVRMHAQNLPDVCPQIQVWPLIVKQTKSGVAENSSLQRQANVEAVGRESVWPTTNGYLFLMALARIGG